MKTITVDKCKELLGLTTSDYDSDISSKIPYIDSKVKMITGNRHNTMIYGNTISGSKYVEVQSIILYNGRRYNVDKTSRRFVASGFNNPYILDDLDEYIEIGQLIAGEGIEDDTYVDELYSFGSSITLEDVDYTVPVVKLSQEATETATGVNIFLGISIGLQDTIAKGIQYLINKTTSTLPGRTLSSVGSVSYSDSDSAIDGKYGMPAWFVKAFPIYHRGH